MKDYGFVARNAREIILDCLLSLPHFVAGPDGDVENTYLIAVHFGREAVVRPERKTAIYRTELEVCAVSDSEGFCQDVAGILGESRRMPRRNSTCPGTPIPTPSTRSPKSAHFSRIIWPRRETNRRGPTKVSEATAN